MSPLLETLTKYVPKTFPGLNKLHGITQTEIDEHLKLYGGYVTNTNLLREKIAGIVEKGEAGSTEFSELVRRLGFEYNGMRLHELYFENLGGRAAPGPAVKADIEEAFGCWENFEIEFRKIAAMRGVGWAILYKDPETGFLSNHWIGLHEEGHPAGFTPLLVMDVWEHAWTAYLKPTERGRYIDDFFANINWKTVEDRLAK